jgi:protein phosphatase
LLRAATAQGAAHATDSVTGASLNGRRRGRSAELRGESDDAEDEFTGSRRRWPVVTTILVVLVALVAGGFYIGYRATQGQYYLGADGGQVSIFRGINEKIAFISLSSVYRRTGVPLSHVPGDLSLPTNPTTLAKSQATVTSIKHSYTCKKNEDALNAWTARYGGPAPSPSPGSKPPAAPPPKPRVPAYCQAQGAG